MAIELMILSGSRQGERVEVDSDTFRVGDSRRDDIRFESKADPGVRGRRVEFSKTEDGWKIRNVGSTPVTLNQKSVANSMPVRSGDIIRMSDAGPDFSFNIVSGAKRTTVTSDSVRQKVEKQATDDTVTDEEKPEPTADHPKVPWSWVGAVGATVLITCLAAWYISQLNGQADETLSFRLSPIPEQIVNENQRLSVSVAVRDTEDAQGSLRYSLVGDPPEGARIDETTGVFSWTPNERQGPGDYTLTVKAETVAESESRMGEMSFSVHVNEANQQPRVEKTAGRTLHVEVGEQLRHTLSAVDSDQPSQQLRYELRSDSPAGVEIDQQTGVMVWSPTREQGGQTHVIHVRVSDDGQPALYDDTTLRVAVEAFDPWKRAVQKISPAVYLLAVENDQSQDSFPYGTAVAIGPQTLLTSAALAVELERRRRDGWTVLGLQDRGQVRIQIQDIKVHQGFVKLSEAPAEQIYFDLAILSTAKTVPAVCQLASADTLANLESGQPLLCIGYPHEAAVLTRFDFPGLANYPVKATALSSLTAEDPGAKQNAPTLLHVSLAFGNSNFADMPPINLYGSPIVTDNGDVISIYVERAEIPSAPTTAKSSIHYSILPTLAGAWLNGSGRELWVTPVIKEVTNTQSTDSNE